MKVSIVSLYLVKKKEQNILLKYIDLHYKSDIVYTNLHYKSRNVCACTKTP